MRKKGFTLIELLVVIAIIALLLSILLPSLRQVKKQARDVVCKSNLHQWGMIWRLYVDDHNGKFGGNDLAPPMPWIRGQWAAWLRVYWEDQGRQKLLTCPSATRPLKGFIPQNIANFWGGSENTYSVSDSPLPDGTTEIASYGMNLWAFNRVGAPQPSLQNRPNEWHWGRMDVKRAAKIPLFLNAMWRGGGPHYSSAISIDPAADYNGQWYGVRHEMKHFCIDRHNKTINGVFFDLSTQKIPLKHLWKLKWHRMFPASGYPANSGVWPDWMQSFKE